MFVLIRQLTVYIAEFMIPMHQRQRMECVLHAWWGIIITMHYALALEKYIHSF